MANFILIHGTGGNPDEAFYPWLRKELEKKGHNVYTPFFQTPIGQSLGNWTEEFKPYGQYVNEETVFVGRSIGPAFILRLLEESKTSVKAAFLIAGFCSDLGVHQYRPFIETFIDKPFNWEKIRGMCKKFFVYHSDNDTIVQLEKGRELARKLRTRVRLVEGAKHFGFKKFNLLLKDIESLTASR